MMLHQALRLLIPPSVDAIFVQLLSHKSSIKSDVQWLQFMEQGWTEAP